MSEYLKQNVKKLNRRSENALHVARGDKVVKVARILELKVPKILERDGGISDPIVLSNTEKNLKRKIISFLSVTTIKKNIEVARELEIKIPGILLNHLEPFKLEHNAG